MSSFLTTMPEHAATLATKENTRLPRKSATTSSCPKKGNSDATTDPAPWGADIAESPPSYKNAVASIKPTLEKHGSMRVAELPISKPSEGFSYVDRPSWEDFQLRGSKTRRNIFVLVHLAYKAFKNTEEARIKETRHSASPGAAPGPLDEIGPGEVERPIGIHLEWTREWEYVLTLWNICEAGEVWGSRAFLFFNGVQPQNPQGINWKDPSRTQRVKADKLPSKLPLKGYDAEWMRFTWRFCEMSDKPKWGGSFTVKYQKAGKLAKGTSCYGVVTAHDYPWVFFDPINIEK